MIISRIDRNELYDIFLSIDGTRFPGDIPALCFQLGEALKIITIPTIADVAPSVDCLEVVPDGLRQGRQKIERTTTDLAAAWSGEAAEAAQTALLQLQDRLQILGSAVHSEVSAGMADLRDTTRQAAETVEKARLRMIRAFSLTPQLRRPIAGQTARYAALFSLVKTEARQGIYAVLGAYADFDQASMRFIEHAQRAQSAIRPERSGRAGSFLA
jgi:uncharacterized protein YukE